MKGAQLYCKNSLKNAGNNHDVHPEKNLLNKAKSLIARSLDTTWMTMSKISVGAWMCMDDPTFTKTPGCCIICCAVHLPYYYKKCGEMAESG